MKHGNPERGTEAARGSNGASAMDPVKFFRRRQFALGPEYVGFTGWNRTPIAKDYLLTVHPDLPVTHIENAGNSLIMLGYAIDPYAPAAREREILDRILKTISRIDDIIEHLEKLTGRFVLIIKFGEHLWLFHDAVALRQVQYCKDKQGRTWCASQAETLAERF